LPTFGYNGQEMPQPTFSQIQLLIFDLDGTLIDSKTDLVLGVNAMREQLGLVRLDSQVVLSYVGQGVTILIRRALGDSASDEEVARARTIFLDYYRRHLLDNTVPYPGVRDAIQELQGRMMAVLTNKDVELSRQILSGLGLSPYFSAIYGDRSFRQRKPDPVGVLELMREARTSSRQTMMIGDSDTDVLTGRNAGVWTCGVTYGFGAHTLQAIPPDVLVCDLRELADLLNGARQ
jgi:phosphoglycolate phosphatase